MMSLPILQVANVCANSPDHFYKQCSEIVCPPTKDTCTPGIYFYFHNSRCFLYLNRIDCEEKIIVLHLITLPSYDQFLRGPTRLIFSWHCKFVHLCHINLLFTLSLLSLFISIMIKDPVLKGQSLSANLGCLLPFYLNPYADKNGSDRSSFSCVWSILFLALSILVTTASIYFTQSEFC